MGGGFDRGPFAGWKHHPGEGESHKNSYEGEALVVVPDPGEDGWQVDVHDASGAVSGTKLLTLTSSYRRLNIVSNRPTRKIKNSAKKYKN